MQVVADWPESYLINDERLLRYDISHCKAVLDAKCETKLVDDQRMVDHVEGHQHVEHDEQNGSISASGLEDVVHNFK